MNAIVKLYNKNIQSKLGKDIVLTFFVQMIIMISSFVINKILSNKLGVIGYGEYSIIKKTSSVIAFVMLSGMGIALPRYLSIFRVKKENIKEKSIFFSAFAIVLNISLVIGICFYLFRNNLANILLNSTDKANLILPLVSFSFSISISTFLFSYFRGKGKYIRYNISQIIVQLITLGICFYSSYGLKFLLNMWSFSIIIYSFYWITKEFVSDKKYSREIFRESSSTIKLLLKYGIPRLIGDFVLFSFSAIPLIIINNKVDINQTGLYSAAITINNIATPLFAFMGTILLQHVSENIAQKEFKRTNIFINRMLILYVLLSTLFSIAIALFSPLLIQLFFSHEFLPAADICPIIGWSILPTSIYLLLRNPIDAVSVFPHNTINLIISFLLFMVLLYFSKTLKDFSYSFLIANTVMAILSFLSWSFIKRYNFK